MSDGADVNDLDRFREFIYGSYELTHHVYSDQTIAATPGRLAQIREVLSRQLPENRQAKILDFGCGDGLLLSIAEQLGYSNLYGVDVAAGLVKIAQSRTKASIEFCNGLEYLKRAADQSLDVIIAFDVIEHFTRPELLEWSRQVFRVLRPNGRLLVHVPNGASPYYGKIRWGDLTHELAYTPTSLEQLLKPLGFHRFSAWEDAPVAHGLKSTIRAVLWKIVRAWDVFRLAIETGATRGHVLTINFFMAADKPN
jgi:2-polyprenyl-3-methyl-5-hydroxy-6-metoxy-1,4-benzoquinol methylase